MILPYALNQCHICFTIFTITWVSTGFVFHIFMNSPWILQEHVTACSFVMCSHLGSSENATLH